MKTIHFSGRRYAPAFCSLFILIFCFTFSAYSTMYYISPSGSDATGTGTSANPWKTLYKATNTAIVAGDIIHVNPGTYTETTQSLLRPGVSIEGDGVTSVIKSTLTADFTAIILAASATEGTNGNQYISNLKFDGQSLATSAAISVYARKNFAVHHCSFINFKLAAVFFAGKTSLFPNNVEPAVYATGNSFYNNTTTNCAGFTSFGFGHLWVTGQQDMLVHDNVMDQSQRPAGQNGWLIKATDFTKGLKIYNNTLTKSPYPYTSGGFNDYWDFAIEMGDEQGLEIYNNTIQGSIDMNRQSKGSYAYSVYIHDNVIGYPTMGTGFETGIIFEYGTQTAIVENNTFKNITEILTFSTRSLSAVTDITIRKNLAYNIGQTGQPGNGGAIHFISDGSNNYTVSNFAVYNNTFVANAVLRPYYGASFSNAGSINNLSIRNNIFTNFGASAVGANNGDVVNNCSITHNNFYLNGTNIGWNTGTPTNYTNSSNITTNPLFIGAGNYTLQVTSPLVDAGTNVGLPYAGTAPDRGYAEVNLTLPVKLIEFTVTENKEKNLLLWKTVTESNSDYFSVERSANGVTYEAIGRVNATGFSSNIINYNFSDASPLKGINYYRLVMIDKDNSFEYSNIVTIARQTQGISILSANIFTGKKQVSMNVASAQNKKATLAVFDVNGRQFLNEKIELQKGLNNINKNITLAAKGIYYVRLYTENETQVKSMLAAE